MVSPERYAFFGRSLISLRVTGVALPVDGGFTAR